MSSMSGTDKKCVWGREAAGRLPAGLGYRNGLLLNLNLNKDTHGVSVLDQLTKFCT